jgi:hypothetical protein
MPTTPFDEVGARRARRAAIGSGYEFTMDLTDNALDLPEEELHPSPDEILDRYHEPETSDSDGTSATDSDPEADEVLDAISRHHRRSVTHDVRTSPRGSADLSPQTPRHQRSLNPIHLGSRGQPGDRAEASSDTRQETRSLRHRRRTTAATLFAAAVAVVVGVVLSGALGTNPQGQGTLVNQPPVTRSLSTALSTNYSGKDMLAWGSPLITRSPTPRHRAIKTERKHKKLMKELPTQKHGDHSAANNTSAHTQVETASATETTSLSPTTSVTRVKSITPTTPSRPTHTIPTPKKALSDPAPTKTTNAPAGPCQGAGVLAPTSCGKPSL